jgi:uncharacterized membrane protein (DUF373 family)
MASRLPRNLAGIRQDWAVLTAYQRFEAMVALVLQAVVGLVIVVALYRLTISVVEALVLESLNPLEHTVFQGVFGQIMTLLIALEFNHTLRYVAADVRGIIQARIVIVIAILALARKAIILELSEVTPAQVAGLAGLTLALGVTYWLIRDRDDRMVGREARGR